MSSSALRAAMGGATPGDQSLPSLDQSGILGTLPRNILAASKTFFVAPLSLVGLAAGVTNTAQFRADTSHDFVAFLATYRVRNNGTLAIIPDANVLVRLTDEQNRTFSPLGAAGQFEIGAVAGAAGSTPGILPIPLIVSAATAITAEFQNNEAVTVNVRLAFIGFLAGRPA